MQHKAFCFALEPSPCEGYFARGRPPCVCGRGGGVIFALSHVAVPVVPLLSTKTSGSNRPCKSREATVLGPRRASRSRAIVDVCNKTESFAVRLSTKGL